MRIALDQLSWGLADGYAIVAEAGFGELTFRRGPAAARVAVPAGSLLGSRLSR